MGPVTELLLAPINLEDRIEELYGLPDINGFDGFYEPVLEVFTKALSLSHEERYQIWEVHDSLVNAVLAAGDPQYQRYLGLGSEFPVDHLLVNAVDYYVADMTGRGDLWDLVTESWYDKIRKPIAHTLGAMVVQDLIGVHEQWGPDQYTFMTLPWETVIGPLPKIRG